MKLVYTATQKPVNLGDVVTLRDGESVTVDYFTEPHKPNSEGKVTVPLPLKEQPMPELTDERIKAIWLQVGAESEWSELGITIRHVVRTIIAADRAQQQAGQEPVAWLREVDFKVFTPRVHAQWGSGNVPLYAAPQPAQQPLTDEQVQALIESTHFRQGYVLHESDKVNLSWYRMGLRDGEKAQGIGSKR